MPDHDKVDIKLLIADDDRAFRETVLEVVEPYFETIAVDSGEAAIEVIEYVRVDVAILDMHMHLLTGLDTLRALRASLEALPCILMSSQVTDALEESARELDVFSVLRKPPTRKLLLDTIHCALKL